MKNGEGKNPPHEPSKKDYQKSLEHDCQHFLSALRHFSTEDPSPKKDHFITTMDAHLELILSAVPEIKRSGITKEAVQVERTYKAYMGNASLETYAALEHAVETLRQYNC